MYTVDEIFKRESLLLASIFRNIKEENWAKDGETFSLELNVNPNYIPIIVVKEYRGSALILLNGKPYYSLDGYHKYFPLRQGSNKVEAKFSPFLAFGERVKVNPGRPIYAEIVKEGFILWIYLKTLTEFYTQTLDQEVKDDVGKVIQEALRISHFDSITRKQLEVAEEFDSIQPDFATTIPSEEENLGYRETSDDLRYINALTFLHNSLSKLREKFGKRGEIYAIGHAHMDAAWLWNFDETRRKVARTFSTVLSLMEEYKDLVFIQSSALYYEWIKEDYPSVFEKIKEKVREGKWILGSGWVESDVNMISLESISRQFLYSQRFFLREFGKKATIYWLPDTFGFPASLPQLVKLGGSEIFATHKVFWNLVNKFPYSVFYWEGIDGTKIKAVAFGNGKGGYNSPFDVPSLLEQWNNWKDKGNPMLYSYGHGDGGGGPTEEMLIRSRAVEESPILPKVNFGIPEFYPTERWRGELYLEDHQGVFTSHSKMKFLNAYAETWLREAEIWSIILGERKDFSQFWKVLLKDQFHDVLPGSAIKDVYDVVYPELEKIIDKAKNISIEMIKKIAGSGDKIMAFNSLSWEREDYVEIDNSEEQQNGGKSIIKVKVPSVGFGEVVNTEGKVEVKEENDKIIMEGEKIRVEINRSTGEFTSLFDKEKNREVLKQWGNKLIFYENVPGWADAWNIEQDFEYTTFIPKIEKINILEKGPIRATIEIVWKFRNSQVRERIILYADLKKVELRFVPKMRDRELLVKIWNSFDLNTDKATFEIPGGCVERSTHQNTSWDKARWEVPMLRWVDMDEGNYGVAIVSDFKHGVSIKGTEVGVSISRTPIYPDPYTDNEEVEAKLIIVPHEGNWREAKVYRLGYEAITPIIVVRGKGGSKSFVQTKLILESMKWAEDGGILLRLYEPENVRGIDRIRIWFKPEESFLTDFTETERIRELKANQEILIPFKNFEVVNLLVRP
ncbi:alpha-mannosidase [Candidatus Acidianus copahuensis]|uniref:Alpha-mannosidase n=1 Tax=Candidatus Acidianus copahuensis TaxID=1160895 RepID=A0A031LQE3_9CREN|nr:glycoside hydrolase family 38 C-terminal domain-containing protein [Candidatus Acidianus copahuensis]EZQ10036.1 alpha-mannosidase [Candidatus Acidianus copahuensis]